MDINITDWRDPVSYNYLFKLYADDLAWEFLRRNDDYRQACKNTHQKDEDIIARLWGLVFFG